jgi:hypothetical protein
MEGAESKHSYLFCNQSSNEQVHGRSGMKTRLIYSTTKVKMNKSMEVSESKQRLISSTAKVQMNNSMDGEESKHVISIQQLKFK